MKIFSLQTGPRAIASQIRSRGHVIPTCVCVYTIYAHILYILEKPSAKAGSKTSIVSVLEVYRLADMCAASGSRARMSSSIPYQPQQFGSQATARRLKFKSAHTRARRELTYCELNEYCDFNYATCTVRTRTKRTYSPQLAISRRWKQPKRRRHTQQQNVRM